MNINKHIYYLEKLTRKKVILTEELKTLTGASSILFKKKKHGYDAVVGIIFNDKKEVLLGVATNDDDRFGKLCFPGGGVEGDEHPLNAVKREAFEETGVEVSPQLKIYISKEKPDVAFIVCNYVEGDLKANEEFTNLGWYPLNSLPWDKIYPQNIKLLKFLLK